MFAAVAGMFAWVMRKGVEMFIDFDAIDAYIDETYGRFYAAD